MTVRLMEDVRDMAGNRYAKGSLRDVVLALDGVPEAVGTRYLTLSKDQWEPALTGENLDRLLDRDEEPGHPQKTRDDGEDLHELS